MGWEWERADGEWIVANPSINNTLTDKRIYVSDTCISRSEGVVNFEGKNVSNEILVSSASTTSSWNISPRFQERGPKQKIIKAAKLTENNLKAIGAEIFKIRGEHIIDASDEFGSGLTTPDEDFLVGDWIVEDYDYDEGHAFFRKATPKERRKYDLR